MSQTPEPIGKGWNPYQSMPPEAFWKRAVSDAGLTELFGLYRKKFDLTGQRIATAGSCFAQHIGRVLRESGFDYMDLEPAPWRLNESDRPRYGYGIYSARYGNVYTARQWLQLLQRAFGEFDPAESVWETNGRYYDPFRPSVEPEGFGGEEELRALRVAHLRTARRLFETADVFVFTMGLTEMWYSLVDGAVFPTVPGNAAGRFDASRHMFRNATAAEVLADMRAVIERIRSINPRCKFLLTVSPVPLTATASGNHVLPATVYSKSVLRAVAGQLADEDEAIDYFPSYEIISSHPMRGMFFQPNMREVTRAGVDFVMSHFLKEHRPASETSAPINTTEDDPLDWLMCDEESLDSFSTYEGAAK